MMDLYLSYDTLTRLDRERFERDLERRRQMQVDRPVTESGPRFAGLRGSIGRLLIITGERIRPQIA